MEVFSATITRHLGDPLKPPLEMGQIYKNPVAPESAKKLMSAVEEINSDLQQEKLKKRRLKKLY